MSDFRIELTDLIRPSVQSPPILTQPDGNPAVLTQFSNPMVKEVLNGQREFSVDIPMEHPAAGLVDAYALAARVYYRNQPQPIFWAPVTYSEDYKPPGKVTLHGVDAIRLQHHYLRFGDEALNLPDPTGKGALTVDYRGLTTLLAAAQNTPEQDARDVPSLGIYGFLPFLTERESKIGVERGQEVWTAMQELAEHRVGADFELQPVDDVPGRYMHLVPYDKRGSDRTATVRWHHNVPGQPDTASDVQARPLLPITHAHVIDRNVKYRVTAADTDESAYRGIFVAWVPTDYTVEDGDTEALELMAEAWVDAYSSAPLVVDVKLRPDQAQTAFYQQHFWVGDKVYVQAVRGFRNVQGNYRIREVTVREVGPRGLAQTEVQLVPDLSVLTGGEES